MPEVRGTKVTIQDSARVEQFLTKARELKKCGSRFQQLVQEHESMNGDKPETSEEDEEEQQ